MKDVAEFLLARYGEEEARVRDFAKSPHFPKGIVVRLHWHVELAEIDAKRTIVERILAEDRDINPPPESLMLGDDILNRLATAYADHPDYREEWRP